MHKHKPYANYQRAPFSPLQPRSINTPSIVLSPAPVKAKSGTPLRKGVTRSTPGKKSAAASKAKSNSSINDENASLVAPKQTKTIDSSSDAAMLSPTPKEPLPRSALSPRRMPKSPSPPQGPAKAIGHAEQQIASSSVADTKAKDIASLVFAHTEPSAARDSEQTEQPVVEGTAKAKPVEPPIALRDSKQDPSVGAGHPNPSLAVNPVSSAVMPNTASIVDAPVTSVPAAPIRQVRSSWLSKALGNNVAVASSGNPEYGGLRKSYAAPPQKSNGPIDLTNLRKSLAPAGVLASAQPSSSSAATAGVKRPSEGGDEDEKRPEKVFKIEQSTKPAEHDKTSLVADVTAPATVDSTVMSATSHTPGPRAAQLPTSASSDDGTRVHPPMTQARERQRSDIHKVTKALDELRERAAAKEAHKNKAALSSSTAGGAGPRHTSSSAHDQHRQSAAGSGFLRGLGSLGVGLGRSLGLGGTAKSAEEEAQRLAEELEEDRRAEAEAQRQLARLMAEVGEEAVPIADEAAPEATKEADGDVDEETMPAQGRMDVEVEDAQVIEKPIPRATTVDREDEELIASALSEPSRPASPTRPPTPPPASALTVMPVKRQQTPKKAPSKIDVFESTTPVFSPPKRQPAPLRSGSNQPERDMLVKKTVEASTAPSFSVKTDAKQSGTGSAAPPVSAKMAENDEEMDELVELPDLPEPAEADDERTDTEEEEEIEEADAQEMPAKKMFKSDTDVLVSLTLRQVLLVVANPQKRQKLASSASSGSRTSVLGQSTSSNISHASTIGGKMLGFKPVPGHVKSLSMASAAAKKVFRFLMHQGYYADCLVSERGRATRCLEGTKRSATG